MPFSQSSCVLIAQIRIYSAIFGSIWRFKQFQALVFCVIVMWQKSLPDLITHTLQTVNHVREGNNQVTPRGVTLVLP